MVRALLQEGVAVQVCALTRGEHYEPVLKALGIDVQWVGQYRNPAGRLFSLTAALRGFNPHVLQSAHFFTNLYVGLAAPLIGAVGIGAIRNDMTREMNSNPFWGKYLLTRVGSLISNSQEAVRNAQKLGVQPGRVTCLPNIIDLPEFDRDYQRATSIPGNLTLESRIVVASVGRLVRAKRFDRFIDALALARKDAPELLGFIVGEGPERDNLQAYARQKGLSDQHLIFWGRRDDVPAIFRQTHIFVLTSDHEGLANVLLEAMAARLPVIVTPAGDSGEIVRDGVTGYVLPYDDISGIAVRMVDLARSASLRGVMGHEGRTYVETEYGADCLGVKLLSIYRHTAEHWRSRRLAQALRG
jgi:glycosyltransferase involved in cell wall biosynthesis